MNVVLLKDIEKLGAQGAVVDVKPGFARNYLVPRGLAAPATSPHLKAAAELQRQGAQKAQRLNVEAEALKQRLESQSLTLTLNVGTDGKSFGAITTHDIVEALRQAGYPLEKHAVELSQPIKTLGTSTVTVRIHSHVTAMVKLQVVKA